jgi:hypothetical protein
MRSTQNWSSVEKAEELVAILSKKSHFFRPEQFDDHEPERLHFEPKNFGLLQQMWQSEAGTLDFRRGKPFPVWTAFRQWPCEYNRFNEVTGGIDERYFADKENLDALLSGAIDLYCWGKIDHGFICHATDWEEKNYFGRPTRISGGKITSTGGIWLQEGLPGIYWANFFGPIYVEFLGREKFEELPAYRKEPLPDGGVLVLTGPTPLDFAAETRAAEEVIIEVLGRNAFFEKAYPEKSTSAPVFVFKQLSKGPITVEGSDPIAEVIPDVDDYLARVQRIAEEWASGFKDALDFSSDSLRRVDDYILSKSRRLLHPWTNEDGRLLIKELVAYYGEVLRRTFGGVWRCAKGSSGQTHPVIEFKTHGRRQIEYVFTRVYKFWSDRVRADGLAARLQILKSGQANVLDRLMKRLP